MINKADNLINQADLKMKTDENISHIENHTRLLFCLKKYVIALF